MYLSHFHWVGGERYTYLFRITLAAAAFPDRIPRKDAVPLSAILVTGLHPSNGRHMKHLRYRQNGSALVEFALILPIFLMLLFGMIDFGRGFNTYIGMLNATREGAVWLAKNPEDTTGINGRIATELSWVDLTTAEVTIIRSPQKASYASGDLVTITLEYQYPVLFGALTGVPALTLRTTHTVRVQ